MLSLATNCLIDPISCLITECLSQIMWLTFSKLNNKPIPVMTFAVVTLAGFIGLVTVDKYSFKISQ